MGPYVEIFFSFFSLLFVVTYASMQNMNEDEVQTNPFDVKPGAGKQEFTRSWDDNFHCTFIYKAQGGTKEQWVLSISRASSTGEWLCSVERPGGRSYLFFEEFKVEVGGATLREVQLEKEQGVDLKSDEYLVSKNSVQHVDGKFKSQLARVQLYAEEKLKPSEL